MSLYVFSQQTGGEDAWVESLAEYRDQLIETKQPRFVTVLAVSAITTKHSTPEELAALKFSGPFYVDFDCEDPVVVMGKFREFLRKLEELDVDLNAIELYCTGGRGYHILIPMEMFVAKPPKGGVQALPQIYKEIAYALFVDTLDLRVYSGRKGRQFRVPGVVRENGAYKVGITPEEAKTITVDDYKRLCSAPRPAIKQAKPTLNQGLAVMYAKAEQKVGAALKRRKDSSKDIALLAKFKGGFPPTLLKIMAGEVVPEDKGFHQIALQIAVTANALGKKEADTLALCEPLIQNHVSDGNRYNSPKKRTDELLRLLRYTQDNPCYAYSKGAIKVLVPDGTPAPDLDGMTEEAGTRIAGSEDEDNEDRGGVFISKMGVFKHTDHGALLLIDVSFGDVVLLRDAVDGRQLGFEAEVFVKGRTCGRCTLPSAIFLSKSHFQKFAARHMGAAINATDAHVATVMTILRDTAYMNNNVIYVVGREGLDIYDRQEADKDTPGEYDIMWVSPGAVITESPIKYTFRGAHQKKGFYKSDLMDAPPLEDTPEMRETLDALFGMNSPYVIASLVGWSVSCFHKQIYQRRYNQFPLCHPYGPSGSGKTTTVESVLHLHYYKAQIMQQQAEGATRFGLEGSLVGSASIPCSIDEYKPREMRPGRHSQLKTFFRGAYNSSTFSKGGMGQDVDGDFSDLRSFAYSAPVLFAGEALESETAIVDRSIVVPMSKDGIEGRRGQGNVVKTNRRLLAALGRQLARATFVLNIDQFVETFEANRAVTAALAIKHDSDRPIFNLAVVLTGLDFLGEVLKGTFGGHFEEKLDMLRDSLKDVSHHMMTAVMPESSKALNMLSYISNTEEAMSEYGLRLGVDYMVTEDHVDLMMRNCYIKYVAWARRKGQVVLYDTEEAFLHGIRTNKAVTDKTGFESKLKVSGMEKVYRFSKDLLASEGVEPFKEPLQRK